MVVVCAGKLPEVPVMVTVAAPVVAVALAARVNTLFPVVGLVPNVAVTPVGRPDAARVTLPVKLFVGFTVIVLVPLPPWATLNVLGDADKVKFGVGVTVRLILVVAVKLPEVPVMVTVTVPVVAVALAASVNTLLPVVGLVPNVGVTPLGRVDVTDRFTLPVKPLTSVTVIVLVPLPSCATLKVLGDADNVKLGVGVTVRPMVVVAVRLPDVPVMVTVAAPVVAVALAASVNTLLPVVVLVPNVAVTPVGRPEAASVTLPVKPPMSVTAIVLVPLLPCTTLNVFGAADNVKLGAGFTVSLMLVVAVKLPEVPVMVTVTGPPVVAVALATRVNTLLPVVGFVPNVAVTPVGRPEAARVTLPVKPPISVTAIVLVPLLPCTTLNVLGVADKVKLGGTFTVRLMLVVAVKLPDVPVMVTVAAPVVAVALAARVNTLLPVVGFVPNVAVTPVGRPEAARVTLPVKPPMSVTAIVLVPLLPCTTLNVLGVADSVKLAGGFTVRLMLVVAVKLPEVPVMVTVAAPVVAVALAVRVNTLLPVVGLVPNVAVTPVGRPEAARVTLPVKPPISVTAIVLVPLLPCTTLNVLGVADKVKLGGTFTVRLMLVVAVKLPDVPVMVTVAAPVVAVALAARVNTLLPVVGLVPNVAVTPVGRPEAARVTLPVKPPMSVTAIVLVPLLPCTTLNVLGVADKVKLAGG